MGRMMQAVGNAEVEDVRQQNKPQHEKAKIVGERRRLSSSSMSQGKLAPVPGATGENVLYQVQWGTGALPQQQQPQGYQMSPTSLQQHQQVGSSYTSTLTGADGSNFEALNPPPQELVLSDLNPFPEQIWSFTLFLGCGLVCWVTYLILPRGCRKQYCNAYRKRYPRSMDKDMPASGYYLPANRSMVATATGKGSNRRVMTMQDGRGGVISQTPANSRNPPLLQETSSVSSMGITSEEGESQTPIPTTPRGRYTSVRNPPSPDHPALHRIPNEKILSETMHRLENRGIRLVAHGVHCDPKRVWIQLDLDEEGGGSQSVTWQTEFPRRVPNQSGQVSIVLMRGSLHRIALTNVLYIDVGKKTNALLRLNPTKVPDSTCFSLLTQNGSLDLQANSKLERDALVSCFSMILDRIHGNLDWRALYEASPDPSLVNSSSLGATPTTGLSGLGRSGQWITPTSASKYVTPISNRRTPSSDQLNFSYGDRGGVSMDSRSSSYPSSSKNYPNPSDMLVEV